MALRLSIVIPVLNEEAFIRQSIQDIRQRASDPQSLEIIVSDAGSNDQTAAIAEEEGAFVCQSSRAQRAAQLNRGAALAGSHVLYFLHCDTTPPPRFDDLIIMAVNNGAESGCFRMQFDSSHPILKLYGWFTRINLNLFRGGDQSLFARREVFQSLSGYDEKLTIMEDYDMVNRLQSHGKFKILKQRVLTSPRKYDVNGVIRLQWIFACIQFMHRTGKSQKKMIEFYKRHVN